MSLTPISGQSELYLKYKIARKLGLRAIVAFGVAKYGIQFLFAMLIDEEL